MIAGIFRHDDSYAPFLFGWWVAKSEEEPIIDTSDAVTLAEAETDIYASAGTCDVVIQVPATISDELARAGFSATRGGVSRRTSGDGAG